MNEFREFMLLMGLNGKQVAKAGELIGMGRPTALMCYSGERRLTKTERLAITAVVSQASPWSPDTHSQIAAAGKVMAAVKDVLRAAGPA
ncbi:hypothetical protein [Rhizobium alvei]|uniref:Uncharacterized protein n=1 Tax=Rhizobium alvei TaxID=1132659 RepID=A0ABT8YJX0_9HYPH|nr:hypothetical protein [Rhizobium alvei]MDO6964003.1 hypothetical protein [Rhizobium alvei]